MKNTIPSFSRQRVSRKKKATNLDSLDLLSMFPFFSFLLGVLGLLLFQSFLTLLLGFILISFKGLLEGFVLLLSQRLVHVQLLPVTIQRKSSIILEVVDETLESYRS